MPLELSVEIEEEIYTYEPADNGADPLTAKPLTKCHRWQIWSRDAQALCFPPEEEGQYTLGFSLGMG